MKTVMNEKLSIACACGKKFNTSLARILAGRGKFCSKLCAYKYMPKHRPSPRVKRACLECGVELFVLPKSKRKFCSRVCSNIHDNKYIKVDGQWFKAQCMDCGKWITGHKVKRCLDCHRRFKQASVLIGGEIIEDYHHLHHWVKKHLGKPSKCERCGLVDDSNPRRFHWANLSGEYLKDLSDWMRMCASCHKKYDAARV